MPTIRLTRFTRRGGVGTAAALIFLGSALAGFAGVTFIRIADTDTPIPGGTGLFTQLYSPVIDGTQLAFIGGAGSGPDGQDGVYWHDGSSLLRIADKTTPLPQAQGPTIGFSQVVLRDGVIGFRTTTPYEAFRYADGILTKIVGEDTPVPTTTTDKGTFGGILELAIANNSYYFLGGYLSPNAPAASPATVGVYEHSGGHIRVLFDEDTRVPGETFPFGQLQSLGFDAGPGGVLVNPPGALYAVNDDGTRKVFGSRSVLPNRLRATSVWGPRGGPAAHTFLATGPSDLVPYALRGDAFSQRIVESPRFLVFPYAGGYFMIYKSVQALGLDGNRTLLQIGVDALVFPLSGTEVVPGTVYVEENGRRTRIIGPNDRLDGRIVRRVTLSRRPLSGATCAFAVSFEDGSAAVYRAKLTP